MKQTEDTDKKKDSGSKIIKYIVGSTVLFAVATATLPKIMMNITGKLSKEAAKRANAKKDDDDWGPVIEKKVKTEDKTCK